MNKLRPLSISAVLATSLLTGCATTNLPNDSLKTSAINSVAADLVTTGIGVSSGLAVEGNPLLQHPALMVASGVVRYVMINEINKQDEPYRTNNLSTVSALTWGVALSNVAIIASATNPVGFVVGAITGYVVWKSTEPERQFAQGCAYLRKEQPTLVCRYTR